MDKRVTLICTDEASALETVALRGVLEYFSLVVSTHWIGNKKQFTDLLGGVQSVDDFVVIASHGDNGIFLLPTEESVRFDELHVHLPGRTVISTGCSTGDAAERFMHGECAAYIAPSGYPEGKDAVHFVTTFFWHFLKNGQTNDAFAGAAQLMPKGSEFVMKQR